MKSALAIILTLVISGCASIGTAEPPLHLLGMGAQAETGSRTIVIGPNTTHVNVEGGEIVDFIVDGKQFAWHFFVPDTIPAFDLKRVAPPGMLDRSVMAYLSPDPRYIRR